MCLSAYVSRHHGDISTCINLRFYVQPCSNTRKVSACFLTRASIGNKHNYAKTNLNDTSPLLVIHTDSSTLFQLHHFIKPLFHVATRTVKGSVVSALGSYAAGHEIEPHLSNAFFFFFFKLINLGNAFYLLQVAYKVLI